MRKTAAWPGAACAGREHGRGPTPRAAELLVCLLLLVYPILYTMIYYNIL